MLRRLEAVSARGEPFKLESIVDEEGPTGTEGVGWHRYVITQGGNTIVGHRRGSLENVMVAAEKIVLQLNQRRVGNFSRSILSPRPTPPKTPRPKIGSSHLPPKTS